MIGSPKRIASGIAVWLVILGVLLYLPGHIGRGPQEILLNLLIWIGLAQAWNIIGGVGGQLSLGHSVFVGAGGYTLAMMMIKGGLSWPLAVIGGGLLSALLAWFLALPLLRLSGVYFTIGTSAVAIIALGWMVTWDWTGEARGLNIPLDALPSKTLKFQLIAFLAVLCCVVTYLILHSSFGLRLMAVRDDEGAASALGVSPRGVKAKAFIVSAFLTGLMGSTIAINQASIEPYSMFNLRWTVTALVMVIVGGLGTVWGPVIGAFIIYYLVDRSLQDQPVIQALLSGVLIILVISVAPDGVVGLARSAWAKVRAMRDASDGDPQEPLTPGVVAHA
ncbi:MAG: branched-chain amino acid ABC transporter permease [Actinomycetes bacterium]